MKVIDLLNKIANGEEVPEEISIRGTEYKVGKCWSIENIYILKEEPNSNWLDAQDIWLNTEVEIIEEVEEDKRIKKLDITNRRCWEDCTPLIVEIMAKLNELIDKVNKLNDK